MKSTLWLVVPALVLALTGCVSTKTTQIADSGAAAWRGKTVALTARPPAGFVAMTAGKAMFGAIGAAAMIEAGQKILEENNIADPAPLMARELLTAAQNRYGVVAATQAPAQIDTTDVPKLAQSAQGADLLLDVQGVGRQFRYQGMDWSHYIVDSSYKVRIIDVHQSKLIAEGFCFRTTKAEKEHPSRDQLLADKATLLKATLDAQRAACLGQFESSVLNIPVETAKN